MFQLNLVLARSVVATPLGCSRKASAVSYAGLAYLVVR
jgi:hypothetical protein